MRQRFIVAIGFLLAVLAVPLFSARAQEATCGLTTGVPEMQWEAGLCPQSFCSTDQQCQTNCPSASSAVCVSSVCQYTFPGGGGGGTGGRCPQQRFCSSDSQCVFGAVHGTCVTNVCRC
jgi:hypothetical protein